MTTIVSRLAAVAAFLITSLTCASAAEIKVLSTVGVKHVLEELKPKFEQVSGHKLNIIWGTGASLAKQMQDGERTDVAILTRQGLDSVLKSGKVIAAQSATLPVRGSAWRSRKERRSRTFLLPKH